MATTSATGPLPADIQDLIDQFSAIQQETDALLDGLDDEQFNWRPPDGGWSIAQCFDHLNMSNRVYLDGMRDAMERARSNGWSRQEPIRSSLAGSWFVRSLEPPVKMRGRAPAKSRPAERRHKAEVWPEFVRTHGEIRQMLTAGAGLDLNRARFRNPFIGILRVRVGTAFRVLAAHERRHVAQAAAVRRHEGFPRS